MSKRTSTARYVLPIEVHPSTHVDFCVRVPNDIYHIGAFLGQIYALSRAFSWADDSAHTALAAAAVWREIFDNLKAGSCGQAPPQSGVEGEELLIRQNPTNPCLLETSINGTDWCAFADLSKCIPSGSQPGSGASQPPAGGGQSCYHASMEGSNRWLLPTLVNTGDVLQITNAHGAASDGTVSWYCPNGALFQLGACFGSGSTSSGDPLNTQPHMTLLAKINGVYYNVYNTSLTVPSGVSGASVEFLLNDSNLADNYGNITFDVCVTNNQAAQWCHQWVGPDLAQWTQSGGGTNGQGWGAYDITDQKWHVTCNQYSGQAYESITIEKAFPTTVTLLEIDIYLTYANLGAVNNLTVSLGATTLINAAAYGDSPAVWTGSVSTAAPLKINMLTGHTNGSSTCPGSSGTISKIIMRGTGANPFGSDNC